MRATTGVRPLDRASERGVGLLELVVALSIMAVIGAAVIMAMVSTLDAFSDHRYTGALELDGERALKQVAKSLRQSGNVTVSGTLYPQFMTNGVAPTGFSSQGHTTPSPRAPVGQPSHGNSREIIFLQAANDATTGIPIEGVGGKLVFSTDLFSYILATGSDGTSQLIYRDYSTGTGAFVKQTTIARNVDRFVVDDSTTDATLAAGVLNVQIFFYTTDPHSGPISVSCSSLVYMRDTEEP